MSSGTVLKVLGFQVGLNLYTFVFGLNGCQKILISPNGENVDVKCISFYWGELNAILMRITWGVLWRGESEMSIWGFGVGGCVGIKARKRALELDWAALAWPRSCTDAKMISCPTRRNSAVKGEDESFRIWFSLGFLLCNPLFIIVYVRSLFDLC